MSDPQSQQLLEILANDGGFDDVDQMLEACTTDSVTPGICVNCKRVVDEVEPDANNIHCPHCEDDGLCDQLNGSVKSALVLAELV